jgi:hypothetical protein
MTWGEIWEEIRERIIKQDQDGTVTWQDVKKQVKKENELEKKKWEEIGKSNAEESERLRKKTKFVTSHSIKFTRDEYDKLKTAFCKGKGWSLKYPYTVNLRSITLTGNHKWMPASDVEFHIEIEEQKRDPRTEASNNDTKIDIQKENLKAL